MIRRRFRHVAGALALALVSASAWADDSQRVNLWPVLYYDPPDDMVCFPFFARNRESFVSLPVCWGREFVAVPPTLSWRTEKGGCEDYRVLLGLGGASFAGGSYDRSWLLPLYYHDRDAFLSVAVCWDSDYGAIPAALSWYRHSDDNKYYRALLGLGGVSFAGGSYDQSWLLPLYYHDTHQFLSPLVGWSDRFQAIPAALSWRTTRGECESYRVLLGLGGATFEGGHARNSWMFPMFYWDDEYFLTPLIGWGDRFLTVPAALSWRENAGACESYRLLLGLGSIMWNEDAYERSWVVPFYYHDKNLFLSLLSLWGKDWGACPAALSWHWKDGADESYLALLGLGGLLLDEGRYDCSWLFPLYYQDANRFLSPLVGWGDTFEALPALLSWHTHGADDETFATLLGLWGWTRHGGQYESSWLFPFFYHNADGRFVTLPYGSSAKGWCIPTLLTFLTREKDGRQAWVSVPLLSSATLKDGKVQRIRGGMGLLFDADYAKSDCDSWSVLLFLANYRKNSAGWQFISLLPYSTWADKANRRNDLYGYCLLRSEGEEYSRWSFLWKFFDYENEKGNVSIDAFPGITCDATSDGTVDFSFWYRFFRYRSTSRGLTDLSIFFIPFK